MASEREFLERRYQIICQQMAKVNNYDVDAQGNFYLTYQPDPSIDYSLLLESWLIQKLLNEVKEGYVQKALVSWRQKLGTQWRDHCDYYRQLTLAIIPTLDACACPCFALIEGFALVPSALPYTIVIDETVLLSEFVETTQLCHTPVEQIEERSSRATEERTGERQAVADG